MKTIREYLEEIWTLVNSDKTDFNKRHELIDIISEIQRQEIKDMTERHLKILDND